MTIEIVNLNKSYSALGTRHQVFRNFNLVLPRGRNIGVVGANGSGKSTLLRLIAGAEEPDSGYISRDVRLSWPVGFSGIARMELSGTANARLCARLYDADPDEVVAFTAKFAGLEEFMRWPVKAYSTGMRARFAFAVSMAIDFECLLIDEVLGVGDAEFRVKCNQAILERRGRSDIILVSHNLKDIIRLCDRVVVLGGSAPIVSDDVQKTVKRYAYSLGNTRAAVEL